MRPIPKQLREDIARDPFMAFCIYEAKGEGIDCEGRVEWEHVFTYSGKQINEAWSILPVCTYHHRGAGLNKEYHQYIALKRADIDDLEKRMPRKDWRQIYKYLKGKYEGNKNVA